MDKTVSLNKMLSESYIYVGSVYTYTHAYAIRM